MVSLFHQDYFDRFIRLKLGPAKGQEANTHNLFELKRGK